jgi:hypothetical protein
LASAVARADDNALKSQQQPIADASILVLQDGGVLTGQITRAADWYIVARGGGQMQIAQSRVLLVCRTMGEAYEFRRRGLGELNAADHLRLAEWCIRYELRREAGRELAEARRLEPDLPRLALLERRLEKGNSQPNVKQAVSATAANPRAVPQAKSQSVEGSTAATASAGDLPVGVVELFTRKVQPVLVNNCTTSGCHQRGGAETFQLDRAVLRGEANRRSTMHNLEATLALVDRAHPDQSPLLTIPRKRHGGITEPIFGPRQEQAFKHLVDWVALITPPTDAPPPIAGEEADFATANAAAGPLANGIAKPRMSPIRPLVQTDISSPMERVPAKAQAHESPRKLVRQPAPVRPAAATDGDEPLTLKQPHRLQVGAQLKSWEPRDAFDPEIFNRGQRARPQPQVSAPATQAPIEAAATTAAEKR